MNADFFIHGAPRGQSIWPNTNESYITNFYSNLELYKAHEFVLDIQIRNNISYYTYVCAASVSAEDNRPGSYFAMTLRLDAKYCKDVRTLYELFELIFSKYILGTLIQKVSNSYKFIVSNFNDSNKNNHDIQKVFLDQINNNFRNDLDVITSKSPRQIQQTKHYALEDINSNCFLSDCLNYTKVFVAKEIKSKDRLIKEISGNLNDIKQQKDQLLEQQEILKTKVDRIPVLESEILKLRNAYEEQKKLLDENQSKLLKLGNENRTLKRDLLSDDEVRNALRSLTPSIKILSTYINNNQKGKKKTVVYEEPKPSYPSPTPSKKKGHSKLVLISIFFIGVLLGGLAYYLLFHENINESTIINNTEKKRSTEIEASTDSTIKPHRRVKIIFQGIKENQELTIGKEYTVSVNINKEGEWKMDGFDVVKGNREGDKKLVVKPNKSPATISYYVNEDKIATQEFNANE